METLSEKEFQKKHNCKSCLYYSKMRKCIVEQMCPLEIDTDSIKRKTCPVDKEGNCPYPNEIGTCFGFCLKRLIMEKEERNQTDEQREEEEDDG